MYIHPDILRHEVSNLGDSVKSYGHRVLLAYGGGSIKRIGLYQQIMEQLKDFEVYELSGIAPNPRLESVEQGVSICKERNIEVVLAVGGGSVIDCCKAIAASALTKDKPWSVITGEVSIEQALPIIAVPTMAATGSEMDAGAVISNPETNEKRSFMSEAILPKVSILDPTYTFSVSPRQTAAGCADILSHLMEQYFVPASSYLADQLVEGVMRTVIRYAPVAVSSPDNYDARAQLLWGSNLADNATLCNGNCLCAFGVHGMEHELSAYYDLIHGEGLAILTPNWMRYVLHKAPNEVTPRFAQFGRNVWGLIGEDEIVARQSIESLEKFFASLNLPKTFDQFNIQDDKFDVMARHCIETEGVEYSWIPLGIEDVKSIYQMCL